MKINDKGLELIKHFEGCSLKAYRDCVGILTIGYGHTGDDVFEGQEIDQTTADVLLCEDLEKTEEGVTKLLKCNVNDNQFSALVCFAFNVGLNALKGSHLLSYLNAGRVQDAASEFFRWDHSGGKEISGLLKRREAESALFLS